MSLKSLQQHLSEYDEVSETLGLKSSYNFMNHGYSPISKILRETNNLFQHQASLYLKLIQDFDVTNKTLLDIGCGRGGGVSTYKKFFPFSKIVGLDINPRNIQYCREHFKEIDFFEGNAENLPFISNTFDFITNVESSHCYEYESKFFNEVKRVLKPKGVFFYVDVFSNYFSIENVLPFNKIVKEDITKNVLKACKKDYKKWELSIPDRKAKELYLKLTKEAFLKYSLGEWKYVMYICYN